MFLAVSQKIHRKRAETAHFVAKERHVYEYYMNH